MARLAEGEAAVDKWTRVGHRFRNEYGYTSIELCEWKDPRVKSSPRQVHSHKNLRESQSGKDPLLIFIEMNGNMPKIVRLSALPKKSVWISDGLYGDPVTGLTYRVHAVPCSEVVIRSITGQPKIINSLERCIFMNQ